jgi:hypothetical protein
MSSLDRILPVSEPIDDLFREGWPSRKQLVLYIRASETRERMRPPCY